MLSPTTAKLIQEVFGYIGEEGRKLAEKDPEACLVNLLQEIKKELPEVSATLRFAVEMATYDKDVEEARRQLEQEKAPV